jgi:hypothetical protein
MMRIRIDELLKEHQRTFYWLAKETGIILVGQRNRH